MAGALWERSLLEMLALAGFAEARVHRWTGYRTSSCTEGRWCRRSSKVPYRPTGSAMEQDPGPIASLGVLIAGQVEASRVKLGSHPN